jgi:NAD(P)-dependent dehydrogenase (short-subunit alcohol dehydrogenase family)
MNQQAAVPHSLFDLAGRTALVTGALHGLGPAIVRALAGQGAAVILADTDGPRCEQAAAELRVAGFQATFVQADPSDADSARRLCESVAGVDVLVCNSSTSGPIGPIGDAPDQAWRHVIDVNLMSAVRLSAALIPGMAARGGGSVILMSSISGILGSAAVGVYGVSKAALSQLARSLAVEWGPHNVRVNAVSPGLIQTPITQALIADHAFMEKRLLATPLRRVGQPEEVAGIVAMLASSAGAFMTGHNLVVDGGTTVSDGT